ncbi:MAG: amidohydrolase family protein [Actinomycetota bacterium]|nr:amidohydrolase family protein [Actinomycetota bacterium]
MEILPLVIEMVGEVADPGVAQAFTSYLGTMFGEGSGFTPVRQPFWGSPGPTVDRLTTALPALMYERLDQFGLDFALLYPGVGLALMSCANAEVRQAGTRAINTYYAEIFGSYGDRMTPTAVIPMFTPDEAIAELDHAVGALGLKAVVMTGVVPRPARSDGATGWIDTLGHDSDFDYDPLWARCQELRIVPAFHGIGFGWGSRTSRSNYVYNHLGNFAAAQEAICRSLIMGGVTTRFPDLRFAFLEGGVTWAAQLYADLIGHWQKRNGQAIRANDPAAIDVALADRLIAAHASGPLANRHDVIRGSVRSNPSAAVDRATVDEFVTSGIDGAADVARIFTEQLFFGCEADDPLNALAFTPGMLPLGIRLNAFFGSDIGHWDVPDQRNVLPEAWELVEDGHVGREAFGDFVFGNVARMLTDANPAFFDGTSIKVATAK